MKDNSILDDQLAKICIEGQTSSHFSPSLVIAPRSCTGPLPLLVVLGSYEVLAYDIQIYRLNHNFANSITFKLLLH